MLARTAIALALAALTGCGHVHALRPPLRNAVRDESDRLGASHAAAVEVEETLLRHGLPDAQRHDPAGAARSLAERLERRTPADPNDALALAELSYRAGLSARRSAPELALRCYRDAAVLAALALAGPGLSRPGAAVELHNRAVERLVRLAQSGDRPWTRALADAGLVAVGSSPYLLPERLHTLRVAADYRVRGMDHVYTSCGLGVPVVAERMVEPDSADPQDRFYPRHLRAAATAVVSPGGGLEGGVWRQTSATLTLFDPFTVRAVRNGDRATPLASDRTTPLAVQVADRALPALELTGLFESMFRGGVEAGLYMLRPYEPGKIPVVFVHGLVSSPRAFVQTINELRNDPDLARRYQFWVFLYPTGLPIPRSASELRRSLREARQALDPAHADPAFDRLVLVGHSMGGLLSKMMVQDTGLALWDATIRIPHDRLQAPPEVRDRLDAMLIFEPLPFVGRVVFIASPHRGSRLANALLGRVVSDLVRRPDEHSDALAELEERNGADVIAPDLKGRALNSVANLRTDSPVLTALDRIPIRPTVPYHSIVPLIGGEAGATDGVVAYPSSHLPGAESEQIVDGTHFSQGRPAVTAELRRILLLHLDGP